MAARRDTWVVNHGENHHNVHQASKFKIAPTVELGQRIPIPSNVHGTHEIILLVVGMHEQRHEVDVDA